MKLDHGSHELVAHEEWVGKVTGYVDDVTDKDFVQSRELWHIMLREENGRENFLNNLCPHLGKANQDVIDEAISKSQTTSFSSSDD